MSRYVEIVECGAKNFFRYGNTLIKFNVEQGLTNIFGKNGSGKSCILEIIHYVFFGESYRGINLEEMINNTNNKNLLAYVVIRVTENGVSDKYTIQRGMAPNIKKIFKNDNVKAESIPTTFDKYVVDSLLGFSASTHKKIIAVSAGGQPFLKMKLEDKRQVIDNITNIAETKEYSKLAKNALSESNSRLNIINSEIAINNASLIPYNEVLMKNDQDLDDRINSFRDNIARLQNEIATKDIKLHELDEEYIKITEELTTATKNEKDLILEYNKNNPIDINNKQIDLNSTLKYLREKANEIKNEISKINPDVCCNHCGNSYTVDQANTKRAEKTLELEALVVKGKVTKAELDELNIVIASLATQVESIKKVQIDKGEISYRLQNKKHEIKLLENEINMITSSIERDVNDIDKLEVSRNNSETIMKTKDKIDVLNIKINDLVVEKNEMLEKIEAFQYIIKMCSDEGIKSFVLNKFLPILNRLINYYLRIFNIDISIELTSDYDYVMKSTSGLANNYDGLSGGQKQRINLAILFAQTDLIKIIGNFNTNILFLDEFIDGAVDSEGLNDTLKIMKQISERDNKAIVFISHRLDEVLISDIDHFYLANKIDKDFSDFSKKSREEVLEILNNN